MVERCAYLNGSSEVSLGTGNMERCLGAREDTTHHTKEGEEMSAAALDLPLAPLERSGTFGPKAAVVAIASEKGGVGKTSLAVTLSHLWAEAGHAVLLIDLDTQGNATRHVGCEFGGGAITSATDPHDPAPLVADARAHGFDLVRGGRRLVGAIANIRQRRVPSTALRRLIRPLRDIYDVILIDTPPTLGLIAVNAVVASTHLLVPVQLEGGAVDGLDAVLETADELRDINPELELLGSVAMMHDRRTALSKMLLEEVRRMEYARPLEAVVSRNIAVAEAYVAEEPVTLYNPSSQGAKDYRRVAKELEGRLTHGG